MNRDNLNTILEKYVENFEILNAPVESGGHDEGYKWRVANAFQSWDIDSDDFENMFHKATSDIAKTNLINNATLQPLSGITNLMKEGEVEFVREEFRKLFFDDNGDLEARGDRVFVFTDEVNAKLAEHFPGKWKYEQNRNAVIYYLNLWKPAENYIFKATQAKEWADCIEYGDDFGSGASFSLTKYYKMCDELLEALQDYPEVLELHQARYEKEVEFKDGKPIYDDKRHMLVFDIIYCSHYMNFYRDCPSLGVSTKERIRIAKRREEEERIESEIADIQKEITELESGLVDMPDLVGKTVSHKTYGEGKVTGFENGIYRISFEEKESKFKEDAIAKGFLAIDDKDAMDAARSNLKLQEDIKKKDNILSRLIRELENL